MLLTQTLAGVLATAVISTLSFPGRTWERSSEAPASWSGVPSQVYLFIDVA